MSRGDELLSSTRMGIGASQNISRYRRLAELGRGGMATVYLAAARGPQGFTKLVVLKELRPDLAQDAEFRSMFLDEARLAARLNHPNVVQTYEVGEDGDRHVIVMEFLEGQPLSRARKVLPPALVYFALSNVLTGLEHAHELLDFHGNPLRVVHRDVSPHNIFVTYSGEVKLCDFGIAKAADSSAVTATGDLKGKLSYMAPEQARGDEVDARADLFAVGVVLWETATGRRLWQNLQDVQILAQLLAGSIPSPRSVDPKIDERLDAICMRALAYDKNNRYPNAAAMQADLDAYLTSIGLTPTRRALGEAVAKAFAEDRLRLKNLIEEQLRTATHFTTGEAPAVSFAHASMPSSPSALRQPTGAPGSFSHGSYSQPLHTSQPSQPSQQAHPSHQAHAPPSENFQSLATIVERGGGSSGGRTGTGAVRSIAPPQAPSSGRGLVVGAVLIVLAVLSVGGFVVKSQLSRRAAAAAAASASAAAATVGSAPADDPSAASARGADAGRPTKVTLRATPAGATFFLDNEPITPGADGTIERPGGETHRLRVEAAGFTSEERSITFDADRVVDVRLVRGRGASGTSGTVGGGSPRPAPSARPGAAKPTDPSEVLGY
jgi:serine/threonine protein kinase